MTVAIGLVCKNGVLVASDSMGSDAQIASESIKVHGFSHNPVIWTGSGSTYVMEEVEAVLRAKVDTADANGSPLQLFAGADEPKIRERLKQFIPTTLRSCYKSGLGETGTLSPGQMFFPFPTDFILLGWGAGNPWFLEFSHDGQINSHTGRGFYAVGSGGPFASVCHGLIKHYLSTEVTLDQGMRIAYRAIATTCEVSSGGVAPPVQIAVVDEAGQRVLNRPTIDEVGLLVERWKALEADTLRMTHESAGTDAAMDLPSMEA